MTENAAPPPGGYSLPPPVQEPIMVQRDQNLIDNARNFCMEWFEEKDEETGKFFRFYTGRVKYEDILHEVEHLYSQLTRNAHLSTEQVIVVLCEWVLAYNIMDVQYQAVHDKAAQAFLLAMNKFVTIQLLGGAHDGMNAKLLVGMMGSDRRMTIVEEKNKGILGRFS